MGLIKTDICVIGGGSAGLSLAAGAVQMGAQTVLIERGKMGGDCLNYGCVPSKSLIAAAKIAWTAKHHAADFGVKCENVKVDFQKTHEHVKSVIAGIAPHDSEARFRKLGVRVIKASASFLDRRTVIAGSHKIKAKYFALATGSAPIVPPIEGLSDVPYLTNETIFSLRHCPRHLLILGAGPIGCELAQAFARLGAQVTIIAKGALLQREEEEAKAFIRTAFQRDKIKIIEQAQAVNFATDKTSAVTMRYEKDGRIYKTSGSHLLVATGRRANIEGLNLQAASVETQDGYVKIDNRLRTTNKRIFALGDVRGGGQFTHMAGYDAGIAIRNMLFKLPAKITGAGGHALLPRVTYTDPEIAAAGLSLRQAQDKFGDKNIRVMTADFADNDRARTELATDGMIKAITTAKGKIIGVSICGKGVGDLLLPWIMAIGEGKKISHMAGYIVPYPTFGEISKRVAGNYFTPQLFSNKTRRLVRFIMRRLS